MLGKNQQEITNNWDSEKPVVSICCVTYNHQEYISKALDSFLMQETAFPFEILVHDDASPDNTAEIIKKYEQKYPDLIKPICQTENKKSKLGSGMNPTFNFPRANGKYIALCEGDDYWIDPQKLQKQVSLMEEIKECSVCFHASKHYYENKDEVLIHKYKTNNEIRVFGVKDAILKGGGFMTTASMLFKTKFIQDLPDWFYQAPAGDFALSLLLSTQGKVIYTNDVMCVYRKGMEGSWTNKQKTVSNRFSLSKKSAKLLFLFNSYTNHKYLPIIIWAIFKNSLKSLIVILLIMFNLKK